MHTARASFAALSDSPNVALVGYKTIGPSYLAARHCVHLAGSQFIHSIARPMVRAHLRPHPGKRIQRHRIRGKALSFWFVGQCHPTGSLGCEPGITQFALSGECRA